jgi:hypothetical protein
MWTFGENIVEHLAGVEGFGESAWGPKSRFRTIQVCPKDLRMLRRQPKMR